MQIHNNILNNILADLIYFYFTFLSLSHVRLFVTPWIVCSLPGSSIHGTFQARILKWLPFLSRRSSQPRDWTQVSCIVGRCFTIGANNCISITSYLSIFCIRKGTFNSWRSVNEIDQFKKLKKNTHTHTHI